MLCSFWGREISQTDRISTVTAGSKSGPWIQSIKRQKPWKLAAQEKAQTLGIKQSSFEFTSLYEEALFVITIPSKCLISRESPPPRLRFVGL